MLQAGWPQQDVDAALNTALQQQSAPTPAQTLPQGQVINNQPQQPQAGLGQPSKGPPANAKMPPKRKISKPLVAIIAIVVIICIIVPLLLFDGLNIFQGETAAGSGNSCGTDMDCFYAAADQCDETEVTQTVTMNLFGVEQTTTTFYRIDGVDGGKCVLYLRTEKIDLVFPPEVPKETVDEQKALYKTREGLSGICKFTPSEMTSLMTRWSEGSYSTEDFANADCTGPYFES